MIKHVKPRFIESKTPRYAMIEWFCRHREGRIVDYLFALQILREGTGSPLTPFFIVISEFVIAGGPIILVFVYWCVDKRIGAWGLFNITIGQFATDIVKLTACVYRPWLQDGRLYIVPEVADSATGYSFPSGHTTMACSSFGSIGMWQRRRLWVVLPMVLLALLTAFARNWLGAHTLKDVLVAMALVVVVMAVATAAMRYLDAHPEKDVVFGLGIIAVCGVAAAYVMLKPYPMDYNTAGMLLADPHEMTPDFWGSVGMLLGWTLSWVIERRFIQFDCGGTKGRKAVRFLVGAILFALVYEVAMPALVAGLDPNLGKFLQRFAAFIAAGCLYPAAIKFVQNRSKNTLSPTTQP